MLALLILLEIIGFAIVWTSCLRLAENFLLKLAAVSDQLNEQTRSRWLRQMGSPQAAAKMRLTLTGLYGIIFSFMGWITGFLMLLLCRALYGLEPPRYVLGWLVGGCLFLEFFWWNRRFIRVGRRRMKKRLGVELSFGREIGRPFFLMMLGLFLVSLGFGLAIAFYLHLSVGGQVGNLHLRLTS